jgi:cytochrome c553
MGNSFVLGLLLMAAVAMGCKQAQKGESELSDAEILALADKGQALMEVNCNLCHGAKPSLDESVAPPIVAIKAHYLEANMGFEEFHENMATFLNKPSAESAQMKGAVKRFGIMPFQPYPKETVKAIAAHLYAYKVPQPQWWDAHWAAEGQGKYVQTGKVWEAKNEKLDYAQQGLKIAMATKKQLGKNLMGQLQKEGPAAALTFCNDRAIPLTDSMSVAMHAQVKRVSDKARNPINRANAAEEGILEAYKVLLQDGMDLKPIVDSSQTPVKVYYPITTNSMCLKCHGKPGEDIKPATLDMIKRFYPNDAAQGYGVNEIRGMWRITLNPNENGEL